jgi:hypothetical protein
MRTVRIKSLSRFKSADESMFLIVNVEIYDGWKLEVGSWRNF